MINLYQLQLFLAVVDRGSFSAAASELHLTQPAISLQVRALEERYGVRLFNRQGQRLELTDAGYALIEPARRLLALAQEVEESFTAAQGTLRGRLNLVYSNPYALPTLTTLLSRYHIIAKAVQFSAQLVTEENALEMLLNFQAHFALLTNIPRHKAVEAVLLSSDELLLALPPNHKWQGQTVELQDLRGQKFVLSSPSTELRRISDMALRTAGVNLGELEIVGEVDDVQVAAELVAANIGLTFLTNQTIRKFAHVYNLGTARLRLTENQQQSGLILARENWLVRNLPTPDRANSPTQIQFWELARQLFGPAKN